MIEEEKWLQENFDLIVKRLEEDPRYEFAEYNYEPEEIDSDEE